MRRSLSWFALPCVALLLGVSPVRAASPVKACRKACGKMQNGCIRGAQANRRAAAGACTADKATRRSCASRASRLFRVAKGTCRTARQACRTCCRTPSQSCARAPELPVFTGQFPLPDRGAFQDLPLPPGPDGRGFTLLPLPDGTLFMDPNDRTPVSAAAECATVMFACFHPPQRNWPGCFEGVPRCATETPWIGNDPMCCAAACGERYQALLRDGRNGPAAFAAAIWEAPSCMPGIKGHARGGGGG